MRATAERFTVGVEAAAYFIACEGLTNAIKHAQARSGRGEPQRRNGSLVVSRRRRRDRRGATADGSGLSGLRDRVAAHGGSAADRERLRGRDDADRGAAVRVVIAEDQVLLREGLGRLFEDAGHEVVAASLGDAEGLLGDVGGQRPISSCSTSGCRRASPTRAPGRRAQIKQRHPDIGVLVLSQHIETTHAVELVTLGGFGYLLKDRVLAVSEFLEAAERVARGGSALDPQVVGAPARAAGARPLTELSDREREVLALMAEGLTNAGIAKRLFLSERTVEAHVRHVLLKLDIPEGEDATAACSPCSRTSARRASENASMPTRRELISEFIPASPLVGHLGIRAPAELELPERIWSLKMSSTAGDRSMSATPG